MSLTDKKRRFVVALQSGLSGAKAAIKAGYSGKGSAQAASRLMKDPDVKAALERKELVNKAKAEAGYGFELEPCEVIERCRQTLCDDSHADDIIEVDASLPVALALPFAEWQARDALGALPPGSLEAPND